MFETLSILPIYFWVVIALLIGGGIWSFRRVNDGTGIPLLAVLGTTAAWYVGDAFYNDYAHNHAKLFDAGTSADAWWQVAWFLTVSCSSHRRFTNGSTVNTGIAAVVSCRYSTTALTSRRFKNS